MTAMELRCSKIKNRRSKFIWIGGKQVVKLT